MGTIKLKKMYAENDQVQPEAVADSSFAEDVTEVAEKQQWEDPAVLKEFSEKTDKISRHYKLNNGTAKSIISATASNYFDEAEQKWKPIDNSLSEKQETYESKCGKYKTEISKPEKAKSIKMTASGVEISWEYLGKQNSSEPETFAFEGDPVPTTLSVDASINGALQSKGSRAVYENADKDIDIEYDLSGNNVKENIIIKEKAEEYKYLFALKTQGLKLRVSEDNESLELYTETVNESGETEIKTEATIPAPFMYDANGESSDDVYFELAPETDGKYTFAVVASAEWINADGRAFPVTIDPQIVTGSSEYITKQVQYRNIYSSYSSGCYQTSYSNWYTTSSSYIRVMRTQSQEYKTIITVNKASMPKLDYPVSGVKLVLKPYRISQSGYCNINGKSVYLSGTTATTIDITTKYNTADSSFTVTIEPFLSSNVNAEFYASGTNGPVIEVEYIINGKKKIFVQEFKLAGGLAGQYDVTTGDACIAFEDVSATDSVLGLGISHVYKKNAGDMHIGNNFRLSLNETLSKSYSTTLDADYVYTDALGMKHGFKDTYYYIDKNGQKISINKSLVSVDLDGKLFYMQSGVKYDVKKEQRTKSGLKAVTQYEDFKGVKWLEQRLDEQKQLEQQIDSYRNTLNNFVTVNKITGNIQCQLNETNYEEFEQSIDYTVLLMTHSEAVQYKSLKIQEKSLINTASNDIIPDRSEAKEALLSLYSAYYEINDSIKKHLRVEYLIPSPVQDVLLNIIFSSSVEKAEALQKMITVNNALINNDSISSDIIEVFNDEAVYTAYGVDDNASTDAKAVQPRINGITLKSQMRQRNLYLAQIEIQERDAAAQDVLLSYQQDYFYEQHDKYLDQIKDYYKEYVNFTNQLENYQRQTPVNYLTDGKIVKGFNKDGNLVAIFDKYENTIKIEYDKNNRILNVYEGEEKQIAFDYSPAGVLDSITDTRGRRIEYGYDDNYNLISVKKAGEDVLNFTYDENNANDLIGIGTADKMQSELEYSNGLLSKVTTKSLISTIKQGQEPTAGSETVSECYFSCGDNLTVLTDNKGNKKYYRYDDLDEVYEYYEEENGKVVKAEKYDYVAYEKDNTQSAKQSSLYTKAYNAFTSSDFTGGDTTEIVLDEYNNPTTATTNARALSDGTTREETVTYEYDDDHKCVKESAEVTIKQGASVLKTYTQVTAYSYNAAGNLTRKESYIEGEEYTTGKSVEETVYDKKGNAVKSFSYNSLDSSSKFYTESEYAENGQVLADYDETGENKREYEYISGTNVVRTERLSNGGRYAYGHDESDRVTSISQSTEDGEENSTQTRYTFGEVTEVVSGNTKVNYEYDGKRRVRKVYLNDGENAYQENTYADETLNGVTVEKCTSTNAKSESVTNYTDKQGKVRRITTSAGKNIDYAYNAKGETVSVTDGVSGKTESYTYNDTYDRLTNYRRNAGETEEYTENYTYDAYGKISSVTQSGAAARKYAYTYKNNAARALESITTGTYKFCPQTDKSGRSAGREIESNGSKIAAEYIYYRKVGDHATNMPSAVYFGKKKGEILSITENIKYAYDKTGNIIRIDENGAPVVWYKYDGLNRLVREDNKPLGKTWLYSYDNKGNILCKRTTNFTLKENVEECDFESIQYEYEGDKLLSFGAEASAYDEIGNPITYRGKTVQWSNGRQMVNYNGTAFTYDGLGKRLSKGSVTYTYDGNNRVIKQSNGIEFIYDNSGVAGIVYNNATYVYRKDGQGNIVALIDNSGNIVVKYEYDAWGNHAVLDANGAEITAATHIGNMNPYRYRGYYYDEETGLYYLKSRYYDPETGRFVTIDDITYIDPETINGLNLYAYCGNNPVMRIDENGNKWWHWLLGFFALVALVAVVAVSVVTGGATLVGIGIGFGIGAVSSFIGQGVNNLINGNGFFDNMSIGSILIGGLVGAAYATGLGGIAGSLGIGVAAGTLTASAEQKTLKEIVLNGIFAGISSVISYGVGQIIGKIAYKNSDLNFLNYFNMAKVDGAGLIRSAITAFNASWYTFIPAMTPGVTRAILNYIGKL